MECLIYVANPYILGRWKFGGSFKERGGNFHQTSTKLPPEVV